MLAFVRWQDNQADLLSPSLAPYETNFEDSVVRVTNNPNEKVCHSRANKKSVTMIVTPSSVYCPEIETE